jgi:hypothetical protein
VEAERSETLALDGAGGFDAGSDVRGGLAVARVGKVTVGDAGDIDVQIDAVE